MYPERWPFMQTLNMAFAETNYLELPIHHWLGQILYVIFVLLITLVLMNLLNGLAVDDIQNIMKEVGSADSIFFSFILTKSLKFWNVLN